MDDQRLQPQHLSWLKPMEKPAYPLGLKPQRLAAGLGSVKQWEKVKDTLTANADDQLIVEGYPLIDPKSGANVVLVTSCKSVVQERTAREAKQRSQ